MASGMFLFDDGASRGMAAFRAGRLEDARVLLERVLLGAPDRGDVLLALGLLHLGLGEGNAAAFYFSRALRDDLKNGILLLHLAESLRLAGDDARADDAYAQAMAIFDAPRPMAISRQPTRSPCRPLRLSARGTQPLFQHPWLPPGTALLQVG